MTGRATSVDRRWAARRRRDRLAQWACVLAAVVAVVPLLLILGWIAAKGMAGVDLSLLTELPKGPTEGGGLGHALQGTLVLIGIACAFGVPVGILVGVYLAEFGDNWLGRTARFSADVMAGIPSIVVGVVVYTAVVIPMHGPSALAGGVALAVLMVPLVARTTGELLTEVPRGLREAALALGVPKWRSILRVVLRTAAPGILTGVMLAVARVAGETAPLLFTAGDSAYWAEDVREPVASLPVRIWSYATSPYEERVRQAWAAALVLVLFVLIFDVGGRVLWMRRPKA